MRLRSVISDPLSLAVGNEPVFAGEEAVGRVTSGGYGYTVRRSIAYAFLSVEHAEPATALAVGVFGDRVDAEVVAEPLFDPRGERIRADAGAVVA